MKTSHNLNNAMHAHDSLFIHCEAYLIFHYYEAYPLFHYYVFILCALQFKLYTPILCKSCFLQIQQTNQHVILSFL